MALAAVWLAGRLALLAGALLPGWVTALADLAYVPLLAALVAKPLMHPSQKGRNRQFLMLIGSFFLANLLVHLEFLGLAATGMQGVLLGLYTLLVTITLVGGRIIPGFTSNGLRWLGIHVEPRSHPWIERSAVPLTAAAGLADVFSTGSLPSGLLCLMAGLLHGARLSGWHGHRSAGAPLVWVLHAGYGWLALGFLLRGLSAFLPFIPSTAALHALTAGGVGMLVLGVTTRAALGHSGRPLEPARATVAAYVLVFLAVVFRVFSPMLEGLAPVYGVWLSGALWTAGFGLFVLVYGPICWKPRIDGRPG
jgi:uncharacterized protein involved in response to NO